MELEERFLNGLDDRECPVDALLNVLRSATGQGHGGEARAWAGLLEEVLMARRDLHGMLQLQRVRHEMFGGAQGWPAACRQTLEKTCGDRLQVACVQAAGFSADRAVPESLRRLDVLLKLRPGVECCERTWGFGIVREVDEFAERVTVDFAEKPGHQMALAYAAERLELTGPGHLLSLKHNAPAKLEQQVREDPAEVVRTALRSYGDLDAQSLKEKLAPSVVAEDDWKRFWDAARKTLKTDRLVDFPARRGDPIRLLEKPPEYGDEWFAGLARLRDADEIYRRVEETAAQKPVATLHGRQTAVLTGRLAFAFRAMEDRRPEQTARGILLAERLGLLAAVNGGEDDWNAWLMNPGRFVAATDGMGLRDSRALIEHLMRRDAGAAADLLLAVLPSLRFETLLQALAALEAAGMQEACASRLRAMFGQRRLSAAVALWAARNLERVEQWGLASPGELVESLVAVLTRDTSGLALKAQKQLREVFESSAWLAEAFDRMDAGERGRLTACIRHAPGLDGTTRRAVMGRLVKRYPDLGEIVENGGAPARVKDATRYTSWRSHVERQNQLRRLVEREIPENSREIAVARSYGDLRENAEYKAAKEHQSILQRRKAEYERDLSSVRGTDFGGVPTDRAGMGTGVELRLEDGSRMRLFILGEWDRDETLNIIASRSRLAESLAGHREGEEVVVPGPHGRPQRATIERILELSAEVRAWLESPSSRTAPETS